MSGTAGGLAGSRAERVHGFLFRWLGWLWLAALVAVFGMAALNSEVIWLMLSGMILFALGMFALPVAIVLALGLADPGRVPDRLRIAAGIAGLAGIAWGAWLASQLPGLVGKGMGVPVGLVSAIAVAQLMRTPRPRRWLPPAGSLLALILAWFSSSLPPMFQGTKPRAYIAAARAAATDVVSIEEAVRADSGHFTATPDSILLRPSSGVRIDLSLTSDGYTVRSSHPASTAVCAAYAGSTPMAPAREPGVVACTPYIDPFITTPPLLGLVALGVLVPIVWLAARPGPEGGAAGSSRPTAPGPSAPSGTDGGTGR